MIGNPLTIRIEGNLFKRNYLIYFVIIIDNVTKKKYLYTGQTGDNFHRTARPVFRRLAGHFSDSGGASDNRIYQYIAFNILEHKKPKEKYEKFDDNIKVSVENFLVNSSVEMMAFPILDFSEPSVDIHQLNNKHIKTIEKAVIYKLLTSDIKAIIMNDKAKITVTPLLDKVQQQTVDSLVDKIKNKLNAT